MKNSQPVEYGVPSGLVKSGEHENKKEQIFNRSALGSLSDYRTTGAVWSSASSFPEFAGAAKCSVTSNWGRSIALT